AAPAVRSRARPPGPAARTTAATTWAGPRARRQMRGRAAPLRRTRARPPPAAAEPPGAVDGELRRGGSGQHVGGGQRSLELGVSQPAAALDAQLPEQHHVRRGPAEADAADASPLAHDLE